MNSYYLTHTPLGPLKPNRKAQQLIDQGIAKIIEVPARLNPSKAIVCVMVYKNGVEKIVYIYDNDELEFHKDINPDFTTWLEMDRKLVEHLTGYENRHRFCE